MKKNNLPVLMLTICLNVLYIPVNAQQNKNANITIHTSGHCGECKKTIEKALSFEKGVKEARFDASTARRFRAS